VGGGKAAAFLGLVAVPLAVVAAVAVVVVVVVVVVVAGWQLPMAKLSAETFWKKRIAVLYLQPT
jgi:hypothetical protein